MKNQSVRTRLRCVGKHSICLKIQAGWSEFERLSRAGVNDGDGGSVFAWTVPAVRVRRDAAGRCVAGL